MGRLLDMFINKYNYTDFHELNIDWLIDETKVLLTEVDNILSWKETHEDEYEQLKELYDQIISGEFPDTVQAAFAEWMSENAIDIVGEMIKTVHFGLTNDGYFCAYIPSSWEDVQFDTVNDYSDPLYGHLMLLYD